MSTTIEMTPEGRAHVDKLAGRAFVDDGQRVEWLGARATQIAKLESEFGQVHAELRELAAAHAAEPLPQGGTRISGKLHGQILKAMGRTEPFKDGDELMAALTERDLELTRLNERIHAAEMQETGRRLAAERRELEAAEEKAYPDDFHRRFGQRELLPAAPANAEEAERREIAGRLGLPIEQVV